MARQIKGDADPKRGKEWLGSVRGSLGEARKRLEADKRERQAADRGPGSIILDPKRLDGRNWDAGTVLHTTLGGVKRPITPADLAAFRRNIETLRGRLGSGGITARQVIDLSGAYLAPGKGSDRKRAVREIHHAVPAGFNKGELHVITNAGPASKLTRHHVLVKLPLFDVAVNDANRDSEDAARWLLAQPLRFDCDCSRHRFFFRYLCTSGNFHAGRPEHGYPKIRNPNLIGVACKHVIRTMGELESSPRFRSLVARAIDKERDRDVVKKRLTATQTDADKAAERTPRAIRTSGQIAQRKEVAAMRKAARAAAKAAKPKPKRQNRAVSAIKALAGKLGIGKLAAKILGAFKRK